MKLILSSIVRANQVVENCESYIGVVTINECMKDGILITAFNFECENDIYYRWFRFRLFLSSLNPHRLNQVLDDPNSNKNKEEEVIQ